MDVSILIGTYGDQRWYDRGVERAWASADKQEAHEVIQLHSYDGTLAEVRNQLAEAATGEWLCFLDADDELEEGYLDELRRVWYAGIWHPADFFRVGPLIVPAVSYLSQFEEGTMQRTLPGIPNLGRWPEINECVIGTLVPKRTFLQVGGFRELEAYEDWDLWLRCYKAGAELWHAPQAVYLAHLGTGGRNEPRDPQSIYDRIWRDYLS